jgi:hypothetical protein
VSRPAAGRSAKKARSVTRKASARRRARTSMRRR